MESQMLPETSRSLQLEIPIQLGAVSALNPLLYHVLYLQLLLSRNR